MQSPASEAHPSGEPLLVCDRISKNFGGLRANDQISLSINRGEVVGLLGPNGSGKTTLLNVIAGLYLPDAGQVIFKGNDISSHGPAKRCIAGIARTFQTMRLFLDLSVLDNVMVGAFAQTTKVSVAKARANSAIQYVGLTHKTGDKAKTLSTGQRKRLELARALVTQPELVMLDEVLAGVDPGSRKPILDLLGTLKTEGRTILIVEHNIDLMKTVCERLVALDRGRKVCEGPPDYVLSHEQVIKSYLG